MNLDKIKNLVKQNGDKFIFVENGEPELVVMSFREYQKLAERDANTRMRANDANDYSRHSSGEFESLESSLGSFESPIDRETEFIGPVVAESPGLPVRIEDIRLEDLPI